MVVEIAAGSSLYSRGVSPRGAAASGPVDLSSDKITASPRYYLTWLFDIASQPVAEAVGHREGERADEDRRDRE